MANLTFPGIFLFLIGTATCVELVDILHGNTGVPMTYKKRNTVIDLLIDDLLDQTWYEGERPCLEQTLNILRNVQNSTLWAMWIWDSMQLPVGQLYGSQYHLGNFDQCLRTPWSSAQTIPTQYCLTEIKLADIDPDGRFADLNPFDITETYLSKQTDYKLKFNLMSLGVCLPSVCETRSIHKFVHTLMRLSHFGAVNPDPPIKIQHCQSTRVPPSNGFGVGLLITLAILLTVTVLVCTYYIHKNMDKKIDPHVMDIIKAFDLKSNATDLLSIGKNEIKVMHGIRFLTACIVVVLHVMLVNIMATVGNGLDSIDDFNTLAPYLSHASVVVDTYFMMSGLLLMISFKPETDKPVTPVKLLVKRYFRLIWIFIVIILVSVFLSPHLYHGPLWSKFAKVDQEACQNNWWIGLLMLGNYVDITNVCMVVTWYVPADFHLAMLSTLLYWWYQRDRRGGLYLFGAAAVLATLLPGIVTYNTRANAVTKFDFETLGNHREHITGSPLYVNSHLRASSYLVGLIAGYIFSVYKPANYRKIISKSHSILGALVILVICLIILIMGSAFQFMEYNAFTSALFASLNRIIWAMAMAALIMICEYGTLPLVTEFLSWPPFVPLSKLCYGIYMCHYFFAMRVSFSLRGPGWHSVLKIIQESSGIIVCSGVVSLYLSLFLESPMNNLVALILNTKQSKIELNGVEKNGLKNGAVKENGNGDEVNKQKIRNITKVYVTENGIEIHNVDKNGFTSANNAIKKENGISTNGLEKNGHAGIKNGATQNGTAKKDL